MNIAEAIQTLRPGAEWVIRGDEIEWLDKTQVQPTSDEILQCIQQNSYKDVRKVAYPALGDQLDAIWKFLNGSPGADALAVRDAVAAVKAEYPKNA